MVVMTGGTVYIDIRRLVPSTGKPCPNGIRFFTQEWNAFKRLIEQIEAAFESAGMLSRIGGDDGDDDA